MREMIAIPISNNDIKLARTLLNDVAENPEHEDELFCEVEFMNDVWILVMATWDDDLKESLFEVCKETNRTDAYWLDIDELEQSRYLDVGGEQVIRFCRVA